ncbi:hypothetical protein ACJJTC_011513, partial [Scirpophaga incertulas]
RHLDFGCANIAEVGYRRLGRDRQASWRCAQCKVSGTKSIPSTPVRLAVGIPDNSSTGSPIDEFTLAAPSGAPSRPVTLELVYQELQNIKLNLCKIPVLVSAVEAIKCELSDLKSSFDFNSARIDDFENKLSKIDERPRSKNYTITLKKYVKEEFVSAARSKKYITLADLDLGDSSTRVFVNDHLTAENKKLLNTVKSVAKEKNFAYVWVKYSKIHVRKNDTSPVMDANFKYRSTGTVRVRWHVVSQSAIPGLQIGLEEPVPGKSTSELLQGAEAVLRLYRRARARLAAATKGLDDSDG